MLYSGRWNYGFLKRGISIKTPFPFRTTTEPGLEKETSEKGLEGATGQVKLLREFINKQPHIPLNGYGKKTDLKRERER